MKPKEHLKSLLRLQKLALEVREARKVVEAAPGRIEEIEQRFRERNAEFVALQERHDELDADRKQRSLELETLEQNRKKFMDDLMQVKNQREYAALLKEIDSVKAQIAGHEEAILTEMEELEKLKGQLDEHHAHIAEERAGVAKERAEVEGEQATAEQLLERLGAERDSIEAAFPHKLRSTLRRLEETRQGVFLSKAENGTCQSCFVRVRPQVFQEIKMAARVHSCSNCRRFLYFETALEPAKASEAKAPVDGSPDGVQAVDGEKV